jgi:hypothetical protein
MNRAWTRLCKKPPVRPELVEGPPRPPAFSIGNFKKIGIQVQDERSLALRKFCQKVCSRPHAQDKGKPSFDFVFCMQNLKSIKGL